MTQSIPYTLPDTLEFDDSDLAHNQEGRISARQIEHLKRTRSRLARIRVVMIVGLMILTAAFLSFGRQNDTLVLQLLGVTTSILNAVVVGLLLRGWLRFGADLEDGRVESIDGEVTHTIRVVGRSASYILHIAGEEMNVPKEVFLAFEESASYRVYRARHSKVLLSAEPVEG
ncbi:MAG: hypothetical protein D6737_16835 [Chloroflexi bacterium]|nr:MAG: hypothetical protein D6737_16835 [Chloroflexota bacterium]